ncbi:ragulator complex protein LAMTOR4-like [Pomacea canaliculata]|uniref:ragulator complex protein LAMTOR4-like n=1 Tax=Pomacea canaliculata TaxID=400727 RepID=UPI000D73EFC4|nr:ragulator complex protein LAMTOR4-like [Pomacea canaliculata]
MTGQGIERIPDSLGYLVLTEEGAVVSSGGDLENDENVANKITKMVYSAVKLVNLNDRKDSFKRLTVVFDNFLYAITISNHKIMISKRKYVPQDPVSV